MGECVFSEDSKKILAGEIPEENINYLDVSKIKEQLKNDIANSPNFKSQSGFALEAFISQPYINNFLNNKRNNMSADMLLCICILLNYNIAETKRVLACFNHSFSAHVKRDKLIMKLMNEKKTLDEINQAVVENGFKSLFKEKRVKNK